LIKSFNCSIKGFFHEQSRPDRDNFIRVDYSNIISGMIEQQEQIKMKSTLFN